MSEINPLIPREPVPELALDLVGGGTFKLSEQTPEAFTMVVFYRGLHCPICKGYLGELEKLIDDFKEKGVEVVVASTDGKERAEQAKQDWGLAKTPVAYGLDLDTARRWGLYVSAGIGKSSVGVDEPELFSEPGLFMVKPDGTLYFGTTQTMPFARPKFADILWATGFVQEKNYPARGEVRDTKKAA